MAKREVSETIQIPLFFYSSYSFPLKFVVYFLWLLYKKNGKNE